MWLAPCQVWPRSDVQNCLQAKVGRHPSKFVQTRPESAQNWSMPVESVRNQTEFVQNPSRSRHLWSTLGQLWTASVELRLEWGRNRRNFPDPERCWTKRCRSRPNLGPELAGAAPVSTEFGPSSALVEKISESRAAVGGRNSRVPLRSQSEALGRPSAASRPLARL